MKTKHSQDGEPSDQVIKGSQQHPQHPLHLSNISVTLEDSLKPPTPQVLRQREEKARTLGRTRGRGRGGLGLGGLSQGQGRERGLGSQQGRSQNSQLGGGQEIQSQNSVNGTGTRQSKGKKDAIVKEPTLKTSPSKTTTTVHHHHPHHQLQPSKDTTPNNKHRSHTTPISKPILNTCDTTGTSQPRTSSKVDLERQLAAISETSFWSSNSSQCTSPGTSQNGDPVLRKLKKKKGSKKKKKLPVTDPNHGKKGSSQSQSQGSSTSSQQRQQEEQEQQQRDQPSQKQQELNFGFQTQEWPVSTLTPLEEEEEENTRHPKVESQSSVGHAEGDHASGSGNDSNSQTRKTSRNRQGQRQRSKELELMTVCSSNASSWSAKSLSSQDQAEVFVKHSTTATLKLRETPLTSKTKKIKVTPLPPTLNDLTPATSASSSSSATTARRSSQQKQQQQQQQRERSITPEPTTLSQVVAGQRFPSSPPPMSNSFALEEMEDEDDTYHPYSNGLGDMRTRPWGTLDSVTSGLDFGAGAVLEDAFDEDVRNRFEEDEEGEKDEEEEYQLEDDEEMGEKAVEEKDQEEWLQSSLRRQRRRRSRSLSEVREQVRTPPSRQVKKRRQQKSFVERESDGSGSDGAYRQDIEMEEQEVVVDQDSEVEVDSSPPSPESPLPGVSRANGSRQAESRSQRLSSLSMPKVGRQANKKGKGLKEVMVAVEIIVRSSSDTEVQHRDDNRGRRRSKKKKAEENVAMVKTELVGDDQDFGPRLMRTQAKAAAAAVVEASKSGRALSSASPSLPLRRTRTSLRMATEPRVDSPLFATHRVVALEDSDRDEGQDQGRGEGGEEEEEVFVGQEKAVSEFAVQGAAATEVSAAGEEVGDSDEEQELEEEDEEEQEEEEDDEVQQQQQQQQQQQNIAEAHVQDETEVDELEAEQEPSGFVNSDQVQERDPPQYSSASDSPLDDGFVEVEDDVDGVDAGEDHPAWIERPEYEEQRTLLIKLWKEKGLEWPMDRHALTSGAKRFPSRSSPTFSPLSSPSSSSPPSSSLAGVDQFGWDFVFGTALPLPEPL